MKNKIRFSLEDIETAMEDYDGYCLACGASKSNVEPDAENYHCDECDADKVYGAEQILIMGLVD